MRAHTTHISLIHVDCVSHTRTKKWQQTNGRANFVRLSPTYTVCVLQLNRPVVWCASEYESHVLALKIIRGGMCLDNRVSNGLDAYIHTHEWDASAWHWHASDACVYNCTANVNTSSAAYEATSNVRDNTMRMRDAVTHTPLLQYYNRTHNRTGSPHSFTKMRSDDKTKTKENKKNMRNYRTLSSSWRCAHSRTLVRDWCWMPKLITNAHKKKKRNVNSMEPHSVAGPITQCRRRRDLYTITFLSVRGAQLYIGDSSFGALHFATHSKIATSEKYNGKKKIFATA